MPSRLAMVLSGDPAFFPGLGESGDPGLFTAAIMGARALGGRIFRRRGGTAITRTARTLAARPVTTAIAGGAAAGVAGGALEALLAGAGGGGMGVPGGFTVLRVSRTGRPTKILTPQGRVISLVRRRGGISAAAIRGAFKLARLAHAFGGVARTGRRARRPVRSR